MCCCSFILSCSSFAETKIESNGQILLLTNPQNVGEVNQLRGVAHSLQKLTPLTKWNISELPHSQLQKIYSQIEAALSQENTVGIIVVSSGDYGIDALKQVNEHFFGKNSKLSKNARLKPKIITVHLSHQLLDRQQALLRTIQNSYGVDLMVLPGHALKSGEVELWLNWDPSITTCILETIGVCHDMSKQKLELEYEANKKLIPTAKSYCIVILGGDSQLSDGKKWLYFTPEEAERIATLVFKTANKENQYILVLNGPRTGKHNPKTGELNIEVHCNEQLDAVSARFIQYFQKKGYKKIQLFDFHHGEPSLYAAVLGAALHAQNSTIWIAGESTSMISENIDSLKGSASIYLYEHKAMTETHKRHLQAEYEAGRANWVSIDGEIHYSHSCSFFQSASNSEMVAQKILDLLEDKKEIK